jgi:hypothetical protein
MGDVQRHTDNRGDDSQERRKKFEEENSKSLREQ